jgi:hypothetical protein
VRFTHEVADGLHGAIVHAVKPAPLTGADIKDHPAEVVRHSRELETGAPAVS